MTNYFPSPFLSVDLSKPQQTGLAEKPNQQGDAPVQGTPAPELGPELPEDLYNRLVGEYEHLNYPKLPFIEESFYFILFQRSVPPCVLGVASTSILEYSNTAVGNDLWFQFDNTVLLCLFLLLSGRHIQYCNKKAMVS